MNFFRQALKRHGKPRSITLDGFEPSHKALRGMGMRNEFNLRWKTPVKIRSCKYLNNIVEQDHQRVKFRVSAMLGFKSFKNARTVLAGIELLQKAEEGSVRGASFAQRCGPERTWRRTPGQKLCCSTCETGPASRMVRDRHRAFSSDACGRIAR